MLTALELSKYIITICNKKNNPISNLKLQHILYYIQCYCVAKFNKKLFVDDMDAWQWGACVPNVYYYFCNFGAMPITLEFDEKDFKSILNLENRFKYIINCIIEEKCSISDWDLIKNIHKKGAWSYTFNDGKGLRNVVNFERYYKYKKIKKDLDNL